MSRSIAVGSIAALWSAAAAAAPTTAPVHTVAFHSVDNGYAVDVPADWVPIPTGEIQSRMARASALTAAGNAIFDAGFQPAFLRRWFAYPYVLVIVIPYAKLGLSAPSNDAELDALAHRMFDAAEGSKVLEHYSAAPAAGQSSNAHVSHVDFDLAAARVSFRTSLTSNRFGPLRGMTVAWFGRDAVVELSARTLEEDWDRYGPTARAIAASFRFDAGRTLPRAPAPAAPPPAQPVNGFVVTGATGVAVGSVAALVGTVVLLTARWRRSRDDGW